MSRTFLIASGAPVEPELSAELGPLPPAFLPLGNRRLFVHQRAAIGDAADRVLLSLPERFVPDPSDARMLDELGIERVGVPAGLTLGQSLVYVINVAAAAGAPLSILHGDTLLRGLDMAAEDAISVESEAPPGYRWGHAHVEPDGVRVLPDAEPVTTANGAVLTGYFALADATLLVQTITRRGGDFLGGLADYAERRPLAALTGADWFDFGHASTYYGSRRRVSTARSFNRLVATRRTVVKSGADPEKIAAEAMWFESLPPPMRIHVPAYLGLRREGGQASYALDYLNHPTLADLYVFGRLPRAAWDAILEACDEFLLGCADHAAPPAAAAPGLYLEKTLARLERFAAATGIRLDRPCRLGGAWLPPLAAMAEMAAGLVPPPDALHLSLVHGDFCFSNILFDHRAALVRVIDPRGQDAAGRTSPHGDRRYDIAKLYHSAVGHYDIVVAGRYRLDRRAPLDMTLELDVGPAQRTASEAFLARSFGGLTHREAAAHPIAVLLFLSMLPLHADDPTRQAALLANAMRLFLALDTVA
ncbi:MAG: phosphotransferase [Alphaproteobacteria bacterium]